MKTETAQQGYVVADIDGADALKVCGECAIEYGKKYLGVILTLDNTASWENDNYIIYSIVDGDSESYAVHGNECEYKCGAILDLRPVEDEGISWGELAQLTHATQVARFGFCTCEDSDGENPYTDCPTGEQGVN